jgi:hypothetical protein
MPGHARGEHRIAKHGNGMVAKGTQSRHFAPARHEDESK